MKKNKEKGFTVVELVVSFALISIIVMGMLGIALTYRGKAQVSTDRLSMEKYRAAVTRKIQDDIVKSKVSNITRCGSNQKCITISFQNGDTKNLEISDNDVKNRYIIYGGQRFEVEEFFPGLATVKNEDAFITLPTKIDLEQRCVASDTCTYKIDIPIFHADLEGDYGIHIVAMKTPYEDEEDLDLLITRNPGEYVEYSGTNGCQRNAIDKNGREEAESKNSCLGWNANQSEDTSRGYGYCIDSSSQFSTYGWRIAFIEDDQVFLVAAGAPECVRSTNSFENIPAYQKDLNDKALKYCNPEFIDGKCDSSNVWAINNADFRSMTKALYGTAKDLAQDDGVNQCLDRNEKTCGTGNRLPGGNGLIDNGGYYWFSSVYESISQNRNYALIWSPKKYGYDGGVSTSYGGNYYGLRPVIRLSPTVYVTGGSGTQADPYRISNDYKTKQTGTIIENFEDINLARDLHEQHESPYPWAVKDGRYVSTNNGPGKDNSRSITTLVFTTKKDSKLSFDYGVSSLPNNTLTIELYGPNGRTLVGPLSGEQSGKIKDVILEPGFTYSLRLIYQKREYREGTSFQDIAYIDNLRIIPRTKSEINAGNNLLVNVDFNNSADTAPLQINKGYDSLSPTSTKRKYQWVVRNGRFESNVQGRASITSTGSIEFSVTRSGTLTFDYGVTGRTRCGTFIIRLSEGSSGDERILIDTSGGAKGQITQPIKPKTTYTLNLSYKNASCDSGDGADPVAYIDSFQITSKSSINIAGDKVIEDFEDRMIDEALALDSADSSYPWTIQNNRFESTNQGRYGESTSTIEFTLQKDSLLSFDYGIYNGSNGKLKITLMSQEGSKEISTVLVDNVSGIMDKKLENQFLYANTTYTLELSYNKSRSSGSDTAYIDNFTILAYENAVTAETIANEDFEDQVVVNPFKIQESSSYDYDYGTSSNAWKIQNGHFESNATGTSSSTATIKFTPQENSELNFDYVVSSKEGSGKFTATLTGKNGSTVTLVSEASGEKMGKAEAPNLKSGTEYTLKLTYKNSNLYDLAGRSMAHIDNLRLIKAKEIVNPNPPIENILVRADFDSGSIPSIFKVINGSSYPWKISNNRFQNGNQGKSTTTSTTALEFTVTMDSLLSFDYSLASQYANLTIRLTDNSTGEAINLVSLKNKKMTDTFKNQALVAGHYYTLKLTYTRTSSTPMDEDLAYIDNLTITALS